VYVVKGRTIEIRGGEGVAREDLRALAHELLELGGMDRGKKKKKKKKKKKGV
jgi:hypothetical protein